MPNSMTVGISEVKVSDEAETVLVTYALGSCIAVAAHDPVAKVGGLLHFMLPDSSIASNRERLNPFMFADTGIPLLVQKLTESGASKHRLRIVVAGGAQVVDDKGFFNVGRRNHVAMRKALWKAGLLIQAEATGGNVSRTLWLDVNTGLVRIKEGAGIARELGARPLGGIAANAITYC